MSIWNIIGEIVLFRWLFKSDGHKEDKTDSPFSDNSRSVNRRSFNPGAYRSFDRFHEEQDDYDIMDDF